MLKPIKAYCIEKGIPEFSDWLRAIEIAQKDNCVVEVRWLPNTMCDWYNEYVFGHESPTKLDEKTPKVYGW